MHEPAHTRRNCEEMADSRYARVSLRAASCRNTRSQIVPMLITSVFTWPFSGFRCKRMCVCQFSSRPNIRGDLILFLSAVFSEFVTFSALFLLAGSRENNSHSVLQPASQRRRETAVHHLKEARESPRSTAPDILQSAGRPSYISLFFFYPPPLVQYWKRSQLIFCAGSEKKIK